MFRLVSALLVALAMFFSPVLMASGAGMAHAGAAVQSSGDEHCGGGKAPEHKQKPDTKMSCASACAGFASVAIAMADPAVQPKRLARAAEPSELSGIAPEHEPPPPRA